MREGEKMRTPTWIKPAIWGAIAGSIATVAIGFGWGGWMLPGSTERMVSRAVTAALAPVCVSRSQDQPQKLKELADISYPYARQQFVVKSGWATMPGSDKPNSDLAAACAKLLLSGNQV